MASKTTAPTSSESRAARMIREVSSRDGRYVRSLGRRAAGRQGAGRGGMRLPGTGRVPVWTWSLTTGMHRGDQQMEVGTETPRGVLDFIIAHQSAGSSSSRTFTSRCGNRRRSGAACAISTRAVSTGRSSSSSRRGAVHSEEIERSVMFWN